MVTAAESDGGCDALSRIEPSKLLLDLADRVPEPDQGHRHSRSKAEEAMRLKLTLALRTHARSLHTENVIFSFTSSIISSCGRSTHLLRPTNIINTETIIPIQSDQACCPVLRIFLDWIAAFLVASKRCFFHESDRSPISLESP